MDESKKGVRGGARLGTGPKPADGVRGMRRRQVTLDDHTCETLIAAYGELSIGIRSVTREACLLSGGSGLDRAKRILVDAEQRLAATGQQKAADDLAAIICQLDAWMSRQEEKEVGRP